MSLSSLIFSPMDVGQQCPRALQCQSFSSTASAKALGGRDGRRPQKARNAVEGRGKIKMRERESAGSVGELNYHMGSFFRNSMSVISLCKAPLAAELQSDVLVEAALLKGCPM